MAFGENLRILPVLAIALAGGLAIGLASAFAQGPAPASSSASQMVEASGKGPQVKPVKWVIRERGPKAEPAVERSDPRIDSSAPVRRRRLAANVYYSGCREARAAGVAPIYASEPGYRPEMDGDGDGIACERYRGM